MRFETKYEINVPEIYLPYKNVKSRMTKIFHPFSSTKSLLSVEALQFIETSDCINNFIIVKPHHITPLRILFDSIKSVFSNYLYETSFINIFGDILHPPYNHYIWILYDINLENRINFNEFFLITIMFLHLRPQQMLDCIYLYFL